MSGPRRNTWFTGTDRPVGGTVHVQPADGGELADAERDLRQLCLDGIPHPMTAARVAVLMAEFDRRGAVERRAREVRSDAPLQSVREAAHYILGDPDA